jgi:hypothetical protein
MILQASRLPDAGFTGGKSPLLNVGRASDPRGGVTAPDCGFVFRGTDRVAVAREALARGGGGGFHGGDFRGGGFGGFHGGGFRGGNFGGMRFNNRAFGHGIGRLHRFGGDRLSGALSPVATSCK